MIDTEEGFSHARLDAERAIALNPNLAAGYLDLAQTQMYHDWDWNAAKLSVAKASDLEPGNSEVLRIHSYLERYLGNLDRAIDLYQRSVALDPLRANSYIALGYLQFTVACYPETQKDISRGLELNPQAPYAHQIVSAALLQEGKPQEALQEVALEPSLACFEKNVPLLKIVHLAASLDLAKEIRRQAFEYLGKERGGRVLQFEG